MNISIRTLTCAAALAAFVPLFAQEEEEDMEATENAEEEEVEVQNLGIEGLPSRIYTGKQKYFEILPWCRRVEGQAQVLKPGARDWEMIEETEHYPLGSSYRTVGKDSRLTISFGRDCMVVIVGEASFGTRRQPLDVKSRTISLKSGKITVKLPRNFPEGMFVVSAPGFTVFNLAGDSRYSYEKTGDGDLATIRCITGSLQIRGRHFEVTDMKAANEMQIRTSQDALVTALYGKRGDIMTKLDQGLVKIKDIETGDSHIEARFLEWKLSPQTAVRIHRAVPRVGENMAATVMTFDSMGELKNRCAFTENRYEITTGEQAPTSKNVQKELEAKAAEVTGGEIGGGSSDSGSSDDSASMDSSSSGSGGVSVSDDDFEF